MGDVTPASTRAAPTKPPKARAAASASPPPGGDSPLRRSQLIAAVGLVSAAGLIFEITLTRLFSLLFQYHYAFLAVSLAVLGLGLGAALGRFLTPAGRENQLATLLALSLSFPLTAVALAWLPSTVSVLPHAAVALIPFVLTGLFLALIFARFAGSSGWLYAADLIGATAGVAAVLGLLTLWSAFSVVIFLGALTGLAALALALGDSETFRVSKTLKVWRGKDLSGGLYVTGALAAALFGGGLLVFNLFSARIDFSPARFTAVPRDKTMVNILRDPTQSASIAYTAWDPFARVDVVETNDPTAKYVFTDGGAGSYMLRFDGNLESAAPLREPLEYLPFAVGPVERTLVLGAGAGKDVLLALLAGGQAITAVEVNPAMVKATRRFAGYNGGIFDRPEVQVVVGDGRTFVERTAARYDLIYLNLVYSQAAEPASQALVENYLFTRQAFRAYLDRLAPGGHLAVISHNALEGSRAALTALQAMTDSGTPTSAALDHMTLLMLYSDDPTQRTTVMFFGRDPLTERELYELSQGMARVPGLRPLFMPGGFEMLFRPLRTGQNTIAEFVAADPAYDLLPTDDDRPFFFKLDPGLPPPVVQALIAAASLSALLLLAALWPGTRPAHSGGRRKRLALALYVALIGTGFMLIEVPLIHRFQLLLGYPVLSVVAVLGALLLSAGLGSWLSQRWPVDRLPSRVVIAALSVGAMALLYWLALTPVVRGLLAAPLAWRVLAATGLTALLGFPMGIPFPSALRLAGEQHTRNVALLWALNGAFSVLGSTLAVVMAMTWGFRWAMLAGVAAYLCLAGLAGVMRKM